MQPFLQQLDLTGPLLVLLVAADAVALALLDACICKVNLLDLFYSTFFLPPTVRGMLEYGKIGTQCRNPMQRRGTSYLNHYTSALYCMTLEMVKNDGRRVCSVV